MPSAKPTTVKAYLATLPEERRTVIASVRKTILAHLPKGYEEGMLYGMLSYYIPLERYPETYNKQPLSLVSLASQKAHMALYMTGIYLDAELATWFEAAVSDAGKSLDMGKACVRFRSLADLPWPVVGEAIARTTPARLIACYEASRSPAKSKGAAKKARA